jgi:hypothetical protein
MNRIHVDRSCLPVVIVTMQGVVPDAEYVAYLDEMSAMMAGRQSRIAIVDGTMSEMNSPKHGRMQANWLRKERDALASLNFGTALVINRPVVRFSLSAMLAFAPIPGTFKVVSHLGEAASWASQRLTSLGLSVPPRLLRLANEGSLSSRDGNAA